VRGQHQQHQLLAKQPLHFVAGQVLQLQLQLAGRAAAAAACRLGSLRFLVRLHKACCQALGGAGDGGEQHLALQQKVEGLLGAAGSIMVGVRVGREQQQLRMGL
jgi:hypothetical protein